MAPPTVTCANGEASAPAEELSSVEVFDRMYRAHAKTVLRCLRAFVDAEAVDDCAQEVFLIAAQRLSTRREGTSTRAWLVGIARNVAMHHRRWRERAIRRERLAAPPRAPRSPEQEIDVQANLRFVEAFIAGLAPRYREVFVLANVEGMTAPEISAVLGLRPNTIYTRLARARRAFEAAVRQHESKESA